MKQKTKIAVTGGIGSGKTAVLGMLAKMGYPVFSCDEISRALWKEERYLSALAELFPACTEEGKIVKSKLSALVFSEEAERKRLEAFSHPLIMAELLREMEQYPVCFAEVPLLFEGGFQALFDGVIVVVRAREKRIASVVERDNITAEEVKRRIDSQWTDDMREREDVVILPNDGTEADLEENLKIALRTLNL